MILSLSLDKHYGWLVTVKQPIRIWVNKSHGQLRTYNSNITKQNTRQICICHRALCKSSLYQLQRIYTKVTLLSQILINGRFKIFIAPIISFTLQHVFKPLFFMLYFPWTFFTMIHVDRQSMHHFRYSYVFDVLHPTVPLSMAYGHWLTFANIYTCRSDHCIKPSKSPKYSRKW